MKKLILGISIILALCVPSVEARTLWEDRGFKLQIEGNDHCWVKQELFPQWTGLIMGLTIPAGGQINIAGEGSIDLYIKGKWVRDVGMIVFEGCPTTMYDGEDTSEGPCYITESYRCEKKGNRVLIMVKIPHTFPTSTNRPTKAKWDNRKVRKHVSTYR